MQRLRLQMVRGSRITIRRSSANTTHGSLRLSQKNAGR